MFNTIPDRRFEHCRKWDRHYLEEKFGILPNDYIPMWIADMDFKAPACIQEAFGEIIAQGTYGYTYTYDAFYEAVQKWQFERHHVVIDKEDIVLTYGTVATIHYLLQAFCTKSKCVIINPPVYDPFFLAAQRHGINVIYNELQLNEQFCYVIDFVKLEAQLQEYRPDVYLLCSPQNPSGRIWTKEEIERIYDLCVKYDVLLVSDEVHSEHILFGEYVSAFALNPQIKQQGIVLTSANKAFNFGGLKTSYTLIPNREIREKFKQQLEKQSITTPNIFGIAGIVSAYTEGQEWLDHLVMYLRENYLLTAQFIRSYLPKWQLMELEASYLCWINVTQTGFHSAQLVQQLATEYGVILDEGSHYGAGGAGFVRLNIGTSQELLMKALKRIRSWYSEHVK